MGRRKIKEEIICPQCNISYEGYKHRKFCSRKCKDTAQNGSGHWNWKGGKTEKQCTMCGHAFYGLRFAVMCSVECSIKNLAIANTREGNVNWKGGRIGGNGDYVHILFRNHPKANKAGYIMEHRLIMEKKIGRFLNKDDVVHHINKKKDDNRIENLVLLGKIEHDTFHFKERAEKASIRKMRCKICAILFSFSDTPNNSRRKFCSKKCYKRDDYLKNKEDYLRRAKEWKNNNLKTA